MKGIVTFVLSYLLSFVYIGISGLVLGILVRVLWNAIVPVVFGLSTLSYWQAVGIYILSSLIFKGEVKINTIQETHDNQRTIR